MKKTVLFTLFAINFYASLHAEFLLNFYSGNISIESGNKKLDISTGMNLPPDSVIITGSQGIAAVYHNERNYVINIKPGTRSSLASLYSSGNIHLRSTAFEKFKTEKPSGGETIASTRAQRVDSPDKYQLWIPLYLKREWLLYLREKYGPTAEATEKNSDCEGEFIRGASLYHLYGTKNSEESILKLESAIRECNDPRKFAAAFFVPEAHRILANIYFGLGKYDLSFKHIEAFIKSGHENILTDLSYYIMIVSCRYTGRENEAGFYLDELKNEYPQSELIREAER